MERPVIERANPIDLADAAYLAVIAHQWAKAARLYREAAGACIGANRAAWYEQQAEFCDAKVKVK